MAETPAAAPAEGHKQAAGAPSIFTRPIVSWALYDFANTIFSFAVISFYFTPWIIEDRDQPDWYVGAMNMVVSLLLILALPALGAIADRMRWRVPLLTAFTLGCVTATAALALVGGVMAALVVAGAAIFCYQCALAQYDPLLADVAPEERRGEVSGIGVGVGYLGALVGAGVLAWLVGDGDKQGAFLPTALLYLVFALPALLWVRERPRAVAPANLRILASDATRQLAASATHIVRDHRPVARFLVARFLYADALLTVIAYMGVYMDRIGDFDTATKTTVLGLAMVSAAAGGFLCGRLVRRHGPRFVLTRILVLAIFTLAGAALVGAPWTVWALGPLVGICLGGVWTSDRVFMLRLSPPSARGEFFSIYTLVGRMSSGVGPLVLWGGTLFVLHEHGPLGEFAASRAALVSLALATLLGLWLVRSVDDTPRDWSDDPLERELEQIQR